MARMMMIIIIIIVIIDINGNNNNNDNDNNNDDHDPGPRKGTNGVGANGVTANCICLARGTFWVPICPNLSTYVNCAYIFPQSVKINYFCSGAMSVDPATKVHPRDGNRRQVELLVPQHTHPPSDTRSSNK